MQIKGLFFPQFGKITSFKHNRIFALMTNNNCIIVIAYVNSELLLLCHYMCFPETKCIIAEPEFLAFFPPRELLLARHLQQRTNIINFIHFPGLF